MSSCLSFTLLLQYSTIFCQYFVILLEAFSLTSSRQSRLIHSWSSLFSSWNISHLILVIPTSTGITTSMPQVSLKGVSLVGVLAVVLQAYKTLGSSSGQAPFASSNLALMILSSVRFVTFICPFTCDCLGDENQFLIPRPEQKSLKLWLSNCRPLFDMIARGIPNLQIMFFYIKL